MRRNDSVLKVNRPCCTQRR